jgi:integrase
VPQHEDFGVTGKPNDLFADSWAYLRIEDKLYAIDYEHAVAKLESEALWRVAGTMEKNRRLQYFSFWGDVFEGYVNWLLDNYASKALNRCFPEPHYLSGKDTRPICDSIVICGSTAVLIEAKLELLDEVQLQQHSRPTVKQGLAALRMLFDWMVVGRSCPSIPPAVRGPKHTQRRGKTPVLGADEARALLDAIDTDSLPGLRDRALIWMMVALMVDLLP